jgi:2-succinyl-6-hydroxy-2,4-cyclohexadiene-1-carboxylate synthase
MILELRGLRYHVQRAGSGQALLLLHGFTGSGQEWSGQLESWARHFSVLALDLAGHGRSAAPADPARYALPETLADLLALLDALGIGRTHVAGYSMGGRVALALAAAHAERIEGLVLASASPGLSEPAERQARLASDLALAERIERDGVPAFVAHWEALPLWASQACLTPAERQALHERRLRNRPIGLANSLRGLSTGAQPPLHEALRTLDVPALCIAGELDRKFADTARLMAAALPRGELAIVPGAGHAVHLEAPQVFAGLLTRFLRGEGSEG